MVRKEVLFAITISILLVLSISSVVAQDYLALQGSVSGATTGNITVEIWNAASGGSLLYNSSTDFFGAVNNSRYDILLGNKTLPLSLNFSNTYYMNLIINERDMNFNGTDRQVFQSPVGNLTVNDPVVIDYTGGNALVINKGFNVSGANNALKTNGTVAIENTDSDDALNVSGGGSYFSGNVFIADAGSIPFTMNRFFNISNVGDVSIGGNSGGDGKLNVAGRATFTLNDDDAVNITSGGLTVLQNKLTIGDAGPAGKLIISSSDTDDAVNISGGVIIPSNTLTIGDAGPAGKLIISSSDTDDAVNISGGVIIPSNTLTIGDAGPAGKLIISSSDTDDAVNISGGVIIPSNTLTIGDAGPAGKLIISSSDTDDAVNISGGVYVAGGATLANSVTLTTSKESGFLFNGFNISGADESLRTNGTISILNIDTDDALNVSGASMFRDIVRILAIPPDPVFTINNGFNISGSSGALTTNGTIIVQNTDSDDALNITNGGLYVGQNATIAGSVLTIGVSSVIGNTQQPHITLIDGQAMNKCPYIQMYDDGGQDWFFWINSTGDMRISASAPTTCNTDGEGVGGQPI